MRQIFLRASQNHWLRAHATQYGFMQRTAARFMPGEKLADALAACSELGKTNIKCVLTHLGEGVSERSAAEAVTNEYQNALREFESCGVFSEISIKLTQLGLDLDKQFCFSNLVTLLESSSKEKTVWIDMEQSSYVDVTLELYRQARRSYRNVGVCLQAYLKRTEKDLDALLQIGAAVRLVKGAYNEPSAVAMRKKGDVDENYFRLAQKLLGSKARAIGVRTAIATHDARLIARIIDWALPSGIRRDQLEFQMLYGINPREQLSLAREGYDSRVLVSYGAFWFPWFMRRLAERPANVAFVVRNILGN